MQLRLFTSTAETRKGLPSEGKKRTSYSKCGSAEGSKQGKGALVPMTMEEVAKKSNLRQAFYEVKRNRGAHGSDGRGIEDIERHLDETIEEISLLLLSGKYRPLPVRRVMIPKSGGGERELGIPTVIDRMVCQSILRILQPHIDPTFDESSHGFRPGRSAHSALCEAKQHVEAGYEIVVDLDLERFFDTVNHQRLLAILERRISDKQLVGVIWKLLKAEVVLPTGVVIPREEGTPQGSPLSPLLSNLILDELDQELRRRGARFVRYADDCNIYVRSKRAGQRVMQSVTRFIERKLKLRVNHSKSAVAETHERHFLGFRLIVDRITSEVFIGLSERTKKRLRQKVVELTPRNCGRKYKGMVDDVNVYIKGWVNYFKICTADVTLFKTTDSHIRRRLRAMKLKQWKSRRIRLKQLMYRGVRKATAGRAIYGGKRSLWSLANHPTVNRALSNKSFKDLGLVSLHEEWVRLNIVVVPAVQQSFCW